MADMDLKEMEQKNLSRYMSPFWKFSKILQWTTLRETINLRNKQIAQNGVTVEFEGEKLHFDCLTEKDLSVFLRLKEYRTPSCGDFNAKLNLISVNERLCLYDREEAYVTICHEHTHRVQRALIKHLGDYPKDSKEYRYLDALKKVSEHEKLQGEAFGIKFTGDTYINAGRMLYIFPARHKEMDKDIEGRIRLCENFYKYQINEREAFDEGTKAKERILEFAEKKGLKTKNNKYNYTIEEDLEFLRDKYGAPNLSYDEMCRTIDKARDNIINHLPPTQGNNLEAEITYDTAAMLELFSWEGRFNSTYRDNFLLREINKKNSLRHHYEKDGLTFTVAHPKEQNQLLKFEFDKSKEPKLDLSDAKKELKEMIEKASEIDYEKEAEKRNVSAWHPKPQKGKDIQPTKLRKDIGLDMNF